MSLDEFLQQLSPSTSLDFENTMQVIADNYDYQQVAFKNGDVQNNAGENEGSCKIFAFAQLNKLSEEQTLLCFGRFYRDVLNTPEGNDHGNIRNFMKSGWDGISFEGSALSAK